MSTEIDRRAEPSVRGAAQSSAGSMARTSILRILLFAALWWVLVEGSTYGPGLAVLAIVSAVATSLALVPPGAWRVRPLALVRFAPFFLRESALGGLDAAWRAVHPALPIRPGYLDFHMRLSGETARVFFCACLSLLPGTVSTVVRGAEVRVHVLDADQPVAETLRRLEERIARLFGEEPNAGNGA